MNLTYTPKNSDYMAMLIISICLVLTVLTVGILFHYIRRTYRIRKEIKRIATEKQWYPNFQNHLKNLKTKTMISNFIIIIVFIEFVNGTVRILQKLDSIVTKQVHLLLNHVGIISHLCHIPLLCLFLKVLCLAYLHSPYKFTIMRWTAYIVIRALIVYVSNLMILIYTLKYGDIIPMFFYDGLFVIYAMIDLTTYLLYSRRFYIHLKSRESEAVLSHEKEKYLEYKYLRTHFKVATIIVAIALIFYNLVSIIAIECTMIDYTLLVFSVENFRIWYLIQLLVDIFPVGLCQIIFRVILSLNYKYVLFLILYKYCKQTSYA